MLVIGRHGLFLLSLFDITDQAWPSFLKHSKVDLTSFFANWKQVENETLRITRTRHSGFKEPMASNHLPHKDTEIETRL